MKYCRERPQCRKQLQWYMQYYSFTLEELLQKTIYFTPNMKTQAKKMIDEGRFITAKELHEDERRDNLMRSVGLVR